jgi:ribosomal protein S1
MTESRENFEFEDTEEPEPQVPTEFETLYHQSLKGFREGSVVKGRVVQVQPGAVITIWDVRRRHPRGTVLPEELRPSAGDELEVFFERSRTVRKHPVARAKKMRWDHLNHAYQTGAPRRDGPVQDQGPLCRHRCGGLPPGSQINIRPVRSLDAFPGTLELKIIKMNPGAISSFTARLLEEEQGR